MNLSDSSYCAFIGVDWQGLLEKAKQSQRLRAHVNLHQSYDEPIQKILICIVKGSYIPPHYHRHSHQKELFLVLSGQVKVVFFDQNGVVKEIALLEQGEMIEIFPHIVHTVVCLSESARILEVKQGPFCADDCKEFLDWTIPENHEKSSSLLSWLESAEVGEKYE